MLRPRTFLCFILCSELDPITRFVGACSNIITVESNRVCSNLIVVVVFSDYYFYYFVSFSFVLLLRTFVPLLLLLLLITFMISSSSSFLLNVNRPDASFPSLVHPLPAFSTNPEPTRPSTSFSSSSSS